MLHPNGRNNDLHLAEVDLHTYPAGQLSICDIIEGKHSQENIWISIIYYNLYNRVVTPRSSC